MSKMRTPIRKLAWRCIYLTFMLGTIAICIVVMLTCNSMPSGVLPPERPLFANRQLTDPETGRFGWYTDCVMLKDGSIVLYDGEENLLIVGKRNDSGDLLLMPGREKGELLHAAYKDRTVTLPHWKNAAIFFDQSGLLRVIFLEKTTAHDLFDTIQRDHSKVDQIFEPNSPQSR